MVRSSSGIRLFLVIVTVLLSVVTMVPSLPIVSPDKGVRDEDTGTRVERSTNLTRITGTGRKIRMYIKDKYLQLFTDGTVNATNDDSSDYTILQRTSVNAGQVKIQGVATCTFLCMDSCGLLYSRSEFDDECVFNENLEQHYYNTYSSSKHSDSKRLLYVAISRHGTPRKVRINANSTLGKYSSLTRVLPQPVEQDRIVQLENKLVSMSGNTSAHHNLRHHQLCPPPHHTKITISSRCLKKKKKDPSDETSSSLDTAKDSKSITKRKKYEQTDISGHKRGKKRKVEKKRSKEEEQTLTSAILEWDHEDASVEED